MQKFKWILFISFLTILSIMVGITLFWMLALPNNKALIWVARQWVKGVLSIGKILWNISYQIEGLEHIHRDETVIIASKHQSMWETFILFLHIPKATIILKRELTWIPIFGWWLARLDVLAINRKAGIESLHKILAQAEKLKNIRGYKLIIYPEGTRSLVGAPTKLKGGIFAIYQALQVPIIPVALNSGCFFPKRGKISAGIIKISIQPPLKVGLPKDEMMMELKKILHNESLKLIENYNQSSLGDKFCKIARKPD